MHTTKVFKSGNSQAVRIPKEYTFEEKELYIQRVGSVLVLSSMRTPWSSLRNSLEKFSDDVFSDGRMQPDDQERENL
ncbi:MAG: antitoxin [Candidatus Sabulitectum sp.]|nr:antitoxin [Candidatus Sabulitectum sp.]